VPTMPTVPPPSGGLARVIAFFRRHPVVLLLALTPGIPEYLSGSTPVWPIVLAPAIFFVFLGLNLALYGPGVLLVREALVRWQKGWGWATLLVLGAAYGLLEEGTALSTLFNPKASVVGGLGHYGHFGGVSWVWLVGVVLVHTVLSVGLPIVLLGLALPETRGRPLLTRREIGVAATVYALDIGALAAISGYYRVAAPLLVLAALVALLLWVVARWLPSGILDPARARPRASPRVAFLLGLAYFPVLLVIPALFVDARLPAPTALLADLALAGGLFFAARAAVGREGNRAELVALAFGVLVPIAIFGLFAQLFFPLVLGVDAIFVYFFAVLWRHYRPPPAPRTGPIGG
jgi:hypothetical protein